MNDPWDFCYETCGAHCCRHGRLNLQERELEKVTGDRRQELERTGRLTKEWDGSWTLLLAPGCPALLPDHRCAIYPERPKACREYPIFRFNRAVVTVDDCPLIKSGRLEPHLDALRKDGVNVI